MPPVGLSLDKKNSIRQNGGNHCFFISNIFSLLTSVLLKLLRTTWIAELNNGLCIKESKYQQISQILWLLLLNWSERKMITHTGKVRDYILKIYLKILKEN